MEVGLGGWGSPWVPNGHTVHGFVRKNIPLVHSICPGGGCAERRQPKHTAERQGQGCIRTEEGEGWGVGTERVLYQKWPDTTFPIVKFGFSPDGHFGRGCWAGYPPLPLWPF